MAEPENRIQRLLPKLPMIIINVMFVFIGLAIYFDDGLDMALGFTIQMYLPSIAVIVIFKKYLVNALVLSTAENRKKITTQVILLVSAGLVLSLIIRPFVEMENDPPLLIAISLLLTFTVIGMLLVSTTAYTHHFYNQKLVAVSAEADKVKAELQLLKSQINPHFLFNTLNNIYGLVHMNDKRAPEMISMLSKILRYLLYDCSEQRVSLRKEKELIENYLQLQAMKSDSMASRIDFYSDGLTDKHTIMPMLLINFVENCFKHSDIETNEQGWVNISLEVSENQLHFTTRNTIKKEVKKTQYSGIGLSNTQKMLTAEYGDSHSLMAGPIDDYYEIDLKIDLS